MDKIWCKYEIVHQRLDLVSFCLLTGVKCGNIISNYWMRLSMIYEMEEGVIPSRPVTAFIRDLSDNSSDHTKAESNNFFIDHSK